MKQSVIISINGIYELPHDCKSTSMEPTTQRKSCPFSKSYILISTTLMKVKKHIYLKRFGVSLPLLRFTLLIMHIFNFFIYILQDILQ